MPRNSQDNVEAPSDKGMEMMTPFPVPTHRRLQDTTRAVILTKEKPSLPVPATHTSPIQQPTRRAGTHEVSEQIVSLPSILLT